MSKKDFLDTIVLTCLILSLAACSNSRGDDVRAGFAGTWDLRYNLSVDECGLVAGNILGFVDQHYIEEHDGVLRFSTVSGIIEDVEATLREDGSLLAEDLLAGDLFDDGSFCEFRSAISYHDNDGLRANSILAQTLWCDDGFSCESLGIGEAVRQES